MHFDLSDEQQMLRDGAERYLLENYGFERRRAVLQTAIACDEALWRDFADLGWLALTVPEEAGGLGAGLLEASLLAEALGRRLVLEPVAITGVLCAAIIERSSNAAARGQLLSEIATGTTRMSLACLEPRARHVEEPPATRARRIGGGYVLEGFKILVAGAPAAHQFIVSATLEGPDHTGLFVVNSQSPDLALRGYPLIDGSHAADLEFRALRLAGDALLCEGPAAYRILDEALDRFRVTQVADALGAMEAAMELTAEQIRNRKQFGQPLAAFQALQHRMSEMFVEVQEVRSALYHALAHIEAAPVERNAAVSSAVVVAAEAGRIVGGQGIQLHGGVGMTDEYKIGHYFKHLLVLEKAWGDVDFHLERRARTYR